MTSILILAGSRDGAADPLAQAYGVASKCLVPVAGRSLILWPLDAAMQAQSIGEIIISSDALDAVCALPHVARAVASGKVRLVASAPALIDSIVAAAATASFPLLITTADSALLTAEALSSYADQSAQTGADATLALARRERVLDAHPAGQRRFYEFADGAFSNCNLYWLRDEAALSAARAFSGGGQFIKKPARIAAAFGVLNLVLFRLGRLTLARMMARLSHALGVRIAAVEMTDGRLAIDVDNARSHAVANGLLDDNLSAAA